MKYAFFLFLVSLIGQSCSIPEDQLTAERAKAFYDVYSSRQHFEKFLDYYADSVVIEDMINGDRIVGKKAVSVFFDWSNPAFQLNGTKALVVTEMIIEKNKAVVKGYFNRFKWGQTAIEAMHFTTLLTFDGDGKIAKQIDWINYPAVLIDWTKRKNSNKWIE